MLTEGTPPRYVAIVTDEGVKLRRLAARDPAHYAKLGGEAL